VKAISVSLGMALGVAEGVVLPGLPAEALVVVAAAFVAVDDTLGEAALLATVLEAPAFPPQAVAASITIVKTQAAANILALFSLDLFNIQFPNFWFSLDFPAWKQAVPCLVSNNLISLSGLGIFVFLGWLNR
jgi:hypothetical protein